MLLSCALVVCYSATISAMLAVFILLLFGWLCCFLGRRDPSSLVYFATASGLVYLAFFAYMPVTSISSVHRSFVLCID